MKQTIVNIAYTLCAIMVCLFLGRTINHYVALLPASLYGMILLNFFLHFKLVQASRIEQTISWAIKNMGVCFVPAGVGIINHYDLITQHGFSIIAIIFVTTFMLLTLVGLAVEHAVKNKKLSD